MANPAAVIFGGRPLGAVGVYFADSLAGYADGQRRPLYRNPDRLAGKHLYFAGYSDSVWLSRFSILIDDASLANRTFKREHHLLPSSDFVNSYSKVVIS